MATAKSATATRTTTAEASSLPAKRDASVVLQGETGSTTIQPHVVAKIAGLAVREVPGVHSLVPFGAGQALTRVARSVTGSDYRDLGVNVEVGKVEAAIDVRIVTEYGVSIPQVAAEIRNNVERRIDEMTGLRMKETNVEVVDLYFPGDDAPPVPSARVE